MPERGGGGGGRGMEGSGSLYNASIGYASKKKEASGRSTYRVSNRRKW